MKEIQTQSKIEILLPNNGSGKSVPLGNFLNE